MTSSSATSPPELRAGRRGRAGAELGADCVVARGAVDCDRAGATGLGAAALRAGASLTGPNGTCCTTVLPSLGVAAGRWSLMAAQAIISNTARAAAPVKAPRQWPWAAV